MKHRAGLAGLRTLLQKPLVRRVMAASGSNTYAQATTIAMQLASLPLFLGHWDLATYGQWLVLSTLPAYLAMADGGMLSAAGNRMTMLMGDGKPHLANVAFQSAQVFMAAVAACTLPLVLAGVLLWPAAAGDSSQTRGAVLLLSVAVMAALVGGLPEAMYKATHRYALGAALANTTRLLEWVGNVAGLWWGGDFISVAAGGALMRVLCTAAMSWHAARTTPALQWGFGQASRAEIKSCVAPALSFMAFPAANALNFQGMTLVAAAVMGPAATVVFNTYRTMARVTVQATAIFSNAMWPEFSRIYGQGKLTELGLLYRRSRTLGIVLSVAASVVVYLAAPTLLHHWAGGRIDFVPLLMAVCMVYAGSAGAWHVSRVLLLSTNEHTLLAWPYLLASAACIPLAWGLAHSFGLIGIVGAMLGLELAMLALCSYLARRLVAPAARTKSAEAAA